MIRRDTESPPSGWQEKMPLKTPTWRRVLKVTLGVFLIILLSGVAFVGALFFKYHRIVGAKPGRLQTQVQPGELGRRVMTRFRHK